jgi:hypothetical protein
MHDNFWPADCLLADDAYPHQRDLAFEPDGLLAQLHQFERIRKTMAACPFIFYEVAPAFGFTNGVVNIALSANRTWTGPNGVMNEQVVTAYLRGNVQAALSLRQAIDSALLLANANVARTRRK